MSITPSFGAIGLFRKYKKRISIALTLTLACIVRFWFTASLIPAEDTMAEGKPRDGPATTFQPDPIVSKLLPLDKKDFSNNPIGIDFGLIVVTGWPADNDQLQHPYNDFIEEVKRIFDPAEDAVYLYPPGCLHITVATLHRLTVSEGGCDRETLADFWTNVVRSASQRPSWPKATIEVRISSAQIGSNAGILLWEEVEGESMDDMRQCIQDETLARKKEAEAMGIDIQTLSIPPIIHTSFLRFQKVPVTNGDLLQEKFQNVIPKLKELFPKTLTLDDVKLILEWTPYMHIPNDDVHVLKEIPFHR